MGTLVRGLSGWHRSQHRAGSLASRCMVGDNAGLINFSSHVQTGGSQVMNYRELKKKKREKNGVKDRTAMKLSRGAQGYSSSLYDGKKINTAVKGSRGNTKLCQSYFSAYVGK